MADIELWGGVECTVNRVGDRFFDQLQRSGHEQRLDDLDRFAALGLRALRYPVLWERHGDAAGGAVSLGWAEQRLQRLRALGVAPIIGLLHHGSGPSGTSLIDPGFPQALARYAGAVATCFPWVNDYTPVNEPLTTARFSGLYGHWYPHGRDDGTFARALVGQCRATVLAMQAIRQVNPAARLIQTEDACRVRAASELAYQARFENERRWLSFDLLCGRVHPEHPLFGYLRKSGISEEELRAFVDTPCSPDIVGLNYYLTSDRYLDTRLHRYPAHLHCGNGRHRYVDAEAARACPQGITGHGALLEEAFTRYGRPVALTEVHAGGPLEEQLRWLAEAFREARGARTAGVDVRAVTVWALLGSYDWNSLVTQAQGYYEPGLFDCREPEPRRTALAALAVALAGQEEVDHAALSEPGWWRRPERLHPEHGAPSARHTTGTAAAIVR